jgi:hypothetical protein
MIIIHRPEKAHLNADGLSRLACNSDEHDQELITVSLPVHVLVQKTTFLNHSSENFLKTIPLENYKGDEIRKT